MKKYIRLYNKYEIMSADYYYGTNIKYYILTMPSDGNINFSGTSASAYLYDINMNNLNQGYSVGDKSLTAGSYIVKVNYGTSGGEMAVNSPVLFNPNNLTEMGTGYYTGTNIKYYILTMPSDGNINFSGTSASAYLYDINMNNLNQGYSVGDKSLTAGSYIVKVNYGTSGGEMAVNSPVLN